MGKLVSNSQFWYGEYDYGLKLANFVDSPFKGGLSIIGQVWPSSDKSGRCRTSLTSVVLQTLGGSYALMNQNTTTEDTETKMDHVSVISIKKGPFEHNMLISWIAL